MEGLVSPPQKQWRREQSRIRIRVGGDRCARGAEPPKRCINAAMTQNDIDNGRLICLIGVAPPRPSEFEIFRVSLSTAT